MLELTKTILVSQMDAALRTLSTCIDRCPDALWDGPVCDLKFCQAVFHTLFFTDCYLGRDTESLKQQAFHRDHPEFFRNYEELEDKLQTLLYDRPTIRKYLDHCRQKAAEVIGAETAESLTATCGFPWLGFARAELHMYNTRHIQHHAAQLSLRLRLDTGDGVPWTRAGDPHEPLPPS